MNGIIHRVAARVIYTSPVRRGIDIVLRTLLLKILNNTPPERVQEGDGTSSSPGCQGERFSTIDGEGCGVPT